MSVSLLLEMAASSSPDRLAVVADERRITCQTLSDLADAGAGVITRSGAKHLAYLGAGGLMLPLLIFSSSRAALPLTPLNYRLSAQGLQALIDRLADPPVVVDHAYRDVIRAGTRTIDATEFVASALAGKPTAAEFADRTMPRSCCSPRVRRHSRRR